MLVAFSIYVVLFLRNGEEFRLYSNILQEQRDYAVYLPSGFDPGESYPVVYSLDGEKVRHSAILAANARMMHALGLAPKVIVVAVHSMGKRGRDFLSSDAAATFLEFLEYELIPAIENRFPACEQRILSGHSLGGLFAFYALIEKPRLFDAYFSYDPSVLYDDELVNRIRQSDGNAHNKSVYVNSGFHTQRYEQRYDEVIALLKAEEKVLSDITDRYLPLPHSLIMLPGQLEALARL